MHRLFAVSFGTWWIHDVTPKNLLEYLYHWTLWLWSFLLPSNWHEVNFYKPSLDTDFLFQCLSFETDFFLWYSCFLGWELKLRPSTVNVCVYKCIQVISVYHHHHHHHAMTTQTIWCTPAAVLQHIFIQFAFMQVCLWSTFRSLRSPPVCCQATSCSVGHAVVCHVVVRIVRYLAAADCPSAWCRRSMWDGVAGQFEWRSLLVPVLLWCSRCVAYFSMCCQ